jgi:origin recognition complex subunit 2
MWDKKMVHYNSSGPARHHVPTFVPYKVEGLFNLLIISSNGHVWTTKTILVVLQRKKTSQFLPWVEFQLANEKEEDESILTL